MTEQFSNKGYFSSAVNQRKQKSLCLVLLPYWRHPERLLFSTSDPARKRCHFEPTWCQVFCPGRRHWEFPNRLLLIERDQQSVKHHTEIMTHVNERVQSYSALMYVSLSQAVFILNCAEFFNVHMDAITQARTHMNTNSKGLLKHYESIELNWLILVECNYWTDSTWCLRATSQCNIIRR